MRKNKKGVTLIQTVIAVVMIIIMAGFAILNSNDTIAETKVAKAYNEIVELKKAIYGFELLDEEGMEVFIDSKIESLDVYPALASYGKENQEYYYLDFTNDSEILSDTLELRNIENDYIVNVKDIDNIEVFCVKGIEIGNDKFYTENEIVKEYNDIFGGR